jgi:hypothetical protein
MKVKNLFEEKPIIKVCSYCKRTKVSEGVWKSEKRDEKTERISHGICPECVKIHWPHVKKNE